MCSKSSADLLCLFGFMFCIDVYACLSLRCLILNVGESSLSIQKRVAAEGF